MGAKLHGEDFAKSAKAIGFRHQRYTKLVTNIAKDIIEASLINSELNRRRDEAEKAKKAKEDRGENYIKLQYPNPSEARQITPKAALSNYNVFNISNPKHAQAEEILSNLWIKDCKDGSRPITWLELYMTYRLRGYHKPIDDPPSAARNKATLDKQLKGFKKLVRAVADKDFGGQGDAYLFKLAKARKDMLKGVGIFGMHASLSVNITVSD